MSWFLGGIVALIVGYFTYGRFVERVVGPDDRPTPAMRNPDGVDYVPMPRWKNMLIQLLNIAGTGPVIGVILGIKFGKVALLIIPVGCILMGAVCDFTAAMISLRMNGANLPRIVRVNLGARYAHIFAWALMLLLMLCVAVFINVPAELIDKEFFSGHSCFWWAVAVIFCYYVLATLFPVDKIIGRVYPFFGALLLLGSLAIFVALVVAAWRTPAILADCPAFASFKAANPIFPCIFITIACGIISGFHSTQSPIVARTLRSEREARATFYGMMIVEGVIAMIWAAASLAIYNIDSSALARKGPAVLGLIAQHFLGSWIGGVTVLAVVILAITSGDTALRSARLSLAEELKISQIPIWKRIASTLPLIVVIGGMLWWSSREAKSFNHLWNYFAWGNQFIAVTALLCSTVWLRRKGCGLKSLVTALPAFFMATVVVSYILWTSARNGQPWGLVWTWSEGRLVNCGLPLVPAVSIGVVVAIALVSLAWWLGGKKGGEE